jgi:hypothetical protein
MFYDLRFVPGNAFAVVVVVVGARDFSKGRRELVSPGLLSAAGLCAAVRPKARLDGFEQCWTVSWISHWISPEHSED